MSGAKRRRGRSQERLAKVLVSIAVGLALVVTGGSFGMARADNVGPDRPPGGGGNCPTPYTLNLAAMVLTNATNATIFFWEVSGSGAPDGTANLNFGLTTSYSWGVLSGATVSFAPSGTVRAFIDFLQPTTTYYFQVYAQYYCSDNSGAHWYIGTLGSSWTTSADKLSPFTVSGQVTNSKGQAGTGLLVETSCTDPQGLPSYWTITNSAGKYSVSIPVLNVDTPQGWQYLPCPSGGGVLVSLVNSAQIPPGGNGYTSMWLGYFNESIMILAQQVVNFVLPSNFISPYIPEVIDFSNAPANYGTITYTQTFTASETLEHEWSVSGGYVGGIGISGSTQITKSLTAGSGAWSNNGTLDWGAQWNTSGTVYFNATQRTWNITSLSTYGGAYTDGFSSQYGIAPPTDNLEPGKLPPGAYYLKDSNGKTMQNVGTPAGKGLQGGIETSTTTATSVGITLSFSLSIGIPGTQALSFNAQTGWSQTTSSTYSQDLTWSIGGNQAACYDMFGEGGNPNASPETTDLIGIFYWVPSQVQNGVPTCTGG